MIALTPELFGYGMPLLMISTCATAGFIAISKKMSLSRDLIVSVAASIIVLVLALLLIGWSMLLALPVFIIYIPVAALLSVLIAYVVLYIAENTGTKKKTEKVYLSIFCTTLITASAVIGLAAYPAIQLADSIQEKNSVSAEFPPAYKELLTSAVLHDIRDSSENKKFNLYKELVALLRKSPLAQKDERNEAVLHILGWAVEGSPASERPRFLEDAEAFWKAGDAHENRIVAAVIMGNSQFKNPGQAQTDETFRARVFALKKDASRMDLWGDAGYGYHPDYEWRSLLSWAHDDVERKALFDEFFKNDLKTHTWDDAQEIVPLFTGQNVREYVIQSLIDPNAPVPAKARGLYYGLYIETHNDRWLELADPKALFKNTPEFAGHELFFLSERSILCGDIEKGLKERAEYILSTGYKQFISSESEYSNKNLLYRYDAARVCGNNKNNILYRPYDDYMTRKSIYLPCSTQQRICDVRLDAQLTYRLVICPDSMGEYPWKTLDSNTDTVNVLIDFERMARMCFPEKPTGLPTPEQKECVFGVIKKMDIHKMEQGAAAKQ